MHWRFVAGILWGASAAFMTNALISNPLTNGALYGSVVLVLATGVLIALGGRPGVVVAALATALAGLMTVMLTLMALSSCNSIFCPPPGLIAVLGALSLVSFLAAREINRSL